MNKLSDILEVSVSEILNGCKNERNSQPDEDNTLKNIEYYTKVTKLKYVKISSYIIVGILMLFAVLFTISNYNQFKVYSISSKDYGYAVEGYMIFNQERNLTIIKNIDIRDKFLGTDQEEKVKSIKVSIVTKDKNLVSIFYETSQNNAAINEYLLNKTYFINEDISTKEYILSEDVKINELLLEIKYTNINNQEKTKLIPLKVIKEYSNNKIIY